MKNAIFILIFFFSMLDLSIADSSTTKIREALEKFETTSSGPRVDKCDRTVTQGKLLSEKGDGIDVSVISEEYAVELFKYLAKQKIPFGYPEDGCYARAHRMSIFLDMKGITSGKVFIEGDLNVKTKNSPKGEVSWWFHVAPVVNVRKNGQEIPYVFDPSIFDRPVPVQEWFDIQTKGKKETYYTKRFNYQPTDRNKVLSDYRFPDLNHSIKSLNTYSKVVRLREKGKK